MPAALAVSRASLTLSTPRAGARSATRRSTVVDEVTIIAEDVLADRDTVAVMIPVPPLHGVTDAAWAEPHVTMLMLRNVGDRLPLVLSAVAEVVNVQGRTAVFNGVEYFHSSSASIAYGRVDVDVDTIREQSVLREVLVEQGLEVDDRPWVPHATLAYLQPGQEFHGPAPVGSWVMGTAEVWVGNRRYRDGLTLTRTREGWSSHGVDFTDRDKAWAYAAAREAEAPAPPVMVPSAPAVHTEPRTYEEVVRSQVVSVERLDGTDRADASEYLVSDLSYQPYHHPDGWDTYTVHFGLIGATLPQRNRDGTRVREAKLRRHVLDPDSMRTGPGIPWEYRHSRARLNPRTVRGAARGVVLTFGEHPDGRHLVGRATAWDEVLKNAVLDEARQVSLRYRGRIRKTPGTDDYGNPFDQYLYAIVNNSLASELKGNAGETARVYTAADAERMDRAFASGMSGTVVERADALLELAASGHSGPIFFDLSQWTPARRRADDQADEADRSDQMNPIAILMEKLEAKGVTLADLAPHLDLSPSDLQAAIESESLDEEQYRAMLDAADAVTSKGGTEVSASSEESSTSEVAADGDASTEDEGGDPMPEEAPPADAPPADAPPADPPSDAAGPTGTVAVMVGSEEIQVAEGDAEKVKAFALELANSTERADALTKERDAAIQSAEASRTQELATRKLLEAERTKVAGYESMDVIERADADQMVMDQAQDLAISLMAISRTWAHGVDLAQVEAADLAQAEQISLMPEADRADARAQAPFAVAPPSPTGDEADRADRAPVDLRRRLAIVALRGIHGDVEAAKIVERADSYRSIGPEGALEILQADVRAGLELLDKRGSATDKARDQIGRGLPTHTSAQQLESFGQAAEAGRAAEADRADSLSDGKASPPAGILQREIKKARATY